MSVTMLAGGVARTEFRVPAGLHRCSDAVIVASLAYQIATQVCSDWFAVLLTSGGHGAWRGSRPGLEHPGRAVQALMVGIAIATNRQEARSGHWVVAYSCQSKEIFALWRDQDGDLQAVWEMGPPEPLLTWTEIDFGRQAHAVLEQMTEQQAKVDVAPAETTMRALRRDRARH
ncbi:hypothetical protein [Falsiroseomonas tokyonensis]|uniref:Uncharacterized protein n=1 Tax=Falsiroseomonas tokyonensis TaxID=430521 RepID=A0ABV7BZA7_9PROT|nr:hypothetical protein [Falsiroseomonas tokyonensis]MBU8540187.1 hypothetical protein [Falsiroseomonas tokyonensis]